MWSCGSSDDSVSVEPKIEFSSDINGLILTDAGGSLVIHFTANNPWQARTDQHWCTVSPTSGDAGEFTLTVKAEPNTGYDERNATVDVICGTLGKSFPITQKQKNALLLSSSKVEIDKDGGYVSLEVESNVQVEYDIAEVNREWIKPTTDTRALTTTSLQFKIEPNEDLEKREGTIIVSGGGLSEEVKIYQEGGVPSIILTQNEYVVSDQGESIRIELKSNVPYKMQLPDTNWISEANTRAMSSYTHYLTIAPNEDYDSREATVTFTNEENGISEYVRIVQMQKDAILIAKQEYVLPYRADKLDFEVRSNVELSVECPADWITQVQTRGLTSTYLHFDIAENSSEEVRQSTIIVRSGDLQQEVNVIQNPRPAFSVGQKEYVLDSNGGELEIEVQSNVDYQIQMPEADWLTRITDLPARESPRFNVAPNDSYDERQARIVFYSLENDIYEEVLIRQMQKNALIIAQDSYTIGSKGDRLQLEILTNTELTVTVSDNWITQTATRGLEYKYLYFTIAENTDFTSRDGMITIQGGGLEQEIKIHQEEAGNDREILTRLYQSTGGEQWIHQNNWCTDKPLSEWYGVTVDKDGKVVKLVLQKAGLQGDLVLGGLTKLETFYFNDNQLTSVDVSGCPVLANLDGGGSQLTSLKLPASLQSLNCSEAPVASLDLSPCTELQHLHLINLQVSSLDMSQHTSLESFNYQGSSLQSVNVSGCTSLTNIDLNYTSLTSLDVSGLQALTWLTCTNNPQLRTLKLSECPKLSYVYCPQNQLAELDASGLSLLNELQCWDNQLTSLSVTGCTSLGRLWCGQNLLTRVDVSSCESLKQFDGSENPFTTLDFSGLTKLEHIVCSSCQLSELNTEGCTALKTLDCEKNQLERLSLHNMNLTYVHCEKNILKELSLEQTTGNGLFCYDNLLTSLDASGFQTIECGNNKLTELKVGEPLFMLFCSHNELTEIDFSLCQHIAELNCSDNQIVTLDVTATRWGFDGGMNFANNKLTSVRMNSSLGFDFTGNEELKTISMLEEMEQQINNLPDYFHYTLWGEYNEELYNEPSHKGHMQYPEFIYRSE